jgi:hypothetical protein
VGWRVIIADIIKFLLDYAPIYVVKLTDAQTAMDAFKAQNPEYDDEDDEDGEFDAALADFIFVVPSVFVGLTNADTNYPPSTMQADDDP